MYENVKSIREKEEILEKHAILQDKSFAHHQIRIGNLTWERYINTRWSVFTDMVKRKGLPATLKATQRAKRESELVKEMQKEAIKTGKPLTATQIKEGVYGEMPGVQKKGYGVVLIVFVWIVVLWYLLLGRMRKQ